MTGRETVPNPGYPATAPAIAASLQKLEV
jgi:hypothetical protein